MKSEFILWANYKGLKVYTDKNRTFSFTENIINEVSEVIKRGYPIDKNKGESVEITENIKLNNVNETTTFKGLHSIYTNIIINKP